MVMMGMTCMGLVIVRMLVPAMFAVAGVMMTMLHDGRGSVTLADYEASRGRGGMHAGGVGNQARKMTRIVSWNIQWCRGADGEVRPARTIDALREMGTPELICLQEVAQCFPGLPGGAAEDEVALLCEAFPDHLAIWGPAVDVPGEDGGRARFGNLLLSRLPVGQVFHRLLPAPAEIALPSMQRACIEAVVTLPWGAVRIMTTHLEYYSARQRSAQVAALRGVQAEACEIARNPAPTKEGNPAFAARPRPASALVCGDFNCEPGSDDHAAMVAPDETGARPWQDAWSVFHGSRPHAPSVGLHGAEWPKRAYCCDFAFLTVDMASRLSGVEIVEATAASDHQPLLLTLDD